MKKQQKTITSFILTLALVLGLFTFGPNVGEAHASAAAWNGTDISESLSGDGSFTSPYAISSGADLAYLAYSVNNGNSYSEKYIELSTDIDLGGHNWTPIGISSGIYFSGNFDGNHHTISGLTITNSAPSTFYQGLFAYIRSGVITDVNLTDVSINTIAYHVGGLVGSMQNSTVSGISVTGEIIGNSVVGGIAGSINSVGPDIFGTISSSSAICTISSIGTDSWDGDAGGIVGSNNKGKISACAAEGFVSGNTRVGGLIGGNADGCIEHSYSTADVNATGMFVGGLVGSSTDFSAAPEIISCYATGNVSGDSGTVGGLAGITVNTKILKSYAAGSVSSGSSNAGGLVGAHQNNSVIESCYATGSILQGDQAGGLVGSTFMASVVSSYAIGYISPGAMVSGGLAGVVTLTTFSGCFWDTETSGTDNAFAVGTNTGNTGTSTAIMTLNSSIYEAAGWDFSNTWNMGTGSYLYPVFGTNGTPVVPPGPAPGGTGSSGGSSLGDTPVKIDGLTKMSVTGKTESIDGVKTLVFTPDFGKLKTFIETAKDNSEIRIPYTGTSNSIGGAFSGDAIKLMADKNISIGLEMNDILYQIPANAIDFKRAASILNRSADLSGLEIRIVIQDVNHEMDEKIKAVLQSQNFTSPMPAVEFKLIAVNTATGASSSLNQFIDYIERVIKLPDNVDPSKISTGVLCKEAGKLVHVPTKITEKNGKYYAVVKSYTNGILLFIENTFSFRDIENHWSRNEVREMGDRLVVTGVGGSLFEPDREITRAEFAAIMVRALGLAATEENAQFKDVKQGEWYEEYINTAVSSGILKGYGDGTARPLNLITREEAMAIIARSMNITGMDPSIEAGDTEKLLSSFRDAGKASSWAKDDIVSCVKIQVVTGSNGYLKPRDEITRAQVAAIVQRLMRKSALI